MLAGSGGGGAEPHFELAAKCIGVAVFTDGLDGRIARMTNTTSDFGRELDSLADVISFGFAPAILAFSWGVQFLDPSTDPAISRSDSPRRLLRHVSVSGLRLGAAGAIQYSEKSGPQESRPSGPQIFRRPGDSRGRGRRGVYRLRRRISDPLLAFRGSLACAAGFARLPYGQHLALLQLQGHQSPATTFPPDGGRDLRAALAHLELLAAGAAGDGSHLRCERDRRPDRRHRAAAATPQPSPTAGASDWLSPLRGPPQSRWLAARLCWAARFATSSPPQISPRTLSLVASADDAAGSLTEMDGEAGDCRTARRGGAGRGEAGSAGGIARVDAKPCSSWASKRRSSI